MSFESEKTATKDNDDPTFYEDRAALRELEGEATAPEDLAIIEELQKEMGGRALAKENNHQKVLQTLQEEERRRLAGNDWRLPKE